MRFGVFDHMDDSGVPLGRHFEHRLRLVEAYDRAGFHAYHLAEHHGTHLGRAPSPSVFLAAVAQRTSRLRFGPLVYPLPLYHPLRLIEEICMLDHMSGGRFLLGVGRGASPVEVGFYGVDPAEAQARYFEALAVVREGLASERLTFHGRFYHFADVPMACRPVQHPHPPLWYGIRAADAAVWAAVNDVNVVSLAPAAMARAISDRYRAEWRALGKPDSALPAVGLSRHIVVADTAEAALEIGRRGYQPWREAMEYLWIKGGVPFPLTKVFPPSFEELLRIDGAVAGTTAMVRDYLSRQISASGANYIACQMAFGHITLEEALRSVELFAREVMPAFRAAAPTAPG